MFKKHGITMGNVQKTYYHHGTCQKLGNTIVNIQKTWNFYGAYPKIILILWCMSKNMVLTWKPILKNMVLA